MSFFTSSFIAQSQTKRSPKNKRIKGIKRYKKHNGEIVCTLQIENKEESKNIREERQREKTREKNIVV